MKLIVNADGVIEQVTPFVRYLEQHVSHLAWEMEGVQVDKFYPDEGEVSIEFSSKGVARFHHRQLRALLDLKLEVNGKVLVYNDLETETFKERGAGEINVHKMWFSEP